MKTLITSIMIIIVTALVGCTSTNTLTPLVGTEVNEPTYVSSLNAYITTYKDNKKCEVMLNQELDKVIYDTCKPKKAAI